MAVWSARTVPPSCRRELSDAPPRALAGPDGHRGVVDLAPRGRFGLRIRPRTVVLTAVLVLAAAAGITVARLGGPLGCEPIVAYYLAGSGLTRDCYDTAGSVTLSVGEIRQQMKVTSVADAELVRQQLITFVWGQPVLPEDRMPDRVDAGRTDATVAGPPNLERMDVLTVELPFGFVSRAYHFIPKAANGRAAIYQEGHDGSFRQIARSTIAGLLEAGFAVLAFDMPLRGVTRAPAWVDVPGLGPLTFSSGSHWNLGILETESFSPLRLFLDPVLAGVNYLQRCCGYQRIVMVGLSGGGWGTTVYAALDPRIQRSYPVAGSLPFFLRGRHPGSGRFASDGDYEQRVAGFYRIAGYLDLYVLGSLGQNRRQVQILNKYDPCCFAGTTATRYAPLVSERIAELRPGGSYELVIDGSHADHAISEHAIRLIVEDAAAP